VVEHPRTPLGIHYSSNDAVVDDPERDILVGGVLRHEGHDPCAIMTIGGVKVLVKPVVAHGARPHVPGLLVSVAGMDRAVE